MKHLCCSLLVGATLSLSLAGCKSAEPRTDSDAPLPSPSQTASAQDMRAAQALSLGSVRAIEDEVGPYIQAVRCNIALSTINERFAQSGGLTDEQRRSMRQAQAVYERRSAQIGEQNKKSRKEIRADLSAQAEKIPESIIRAQIAIGCLRKLASATKP